MTSVILACPHDWMNVFLFADPELGNWRRSQ